MSDPGDPRVGLAQGISMVLLMLFVLAYSLAHPRPITGERLPASHIAQGNN